MLLLLFMLSVSSDTCHSQYVYNGLLPYDPRYASFRRPVRRSSAMEALERLQLPVARYFPQVDTQVAPAPYQGGYQWTASDLYALPPQWTEDFVQQLPENEDYGNYEYESMVPAYRPSAYADEVYAQEPENSNNLYNDLVDGYLVDGPEEQSDMFEGIQRRSDQEGVVPLSKVLEANENSTTPSPPPAMPSQASLPQVQMTAVPASPEKKNVQSLVVPDALPITEDNSWREEGQKEEPLFRPLQNSQRTTWSTLNRAKNTPQHKSPIPFLKQMIQSGGALKEDPLLEELKNLKKKA